MTSITGEVRINAPKEKVWDIISVFGNVQEYGSTVTNSYATSEVTGGIGATRHCDLAPDGTAEERIVEWEEGVGYKFEAYKADPPPPVNHATASIYLKADGDATIVYGSFAYEFKDELADVVDAAQLRAVFEQMWASFFAGLKYHVETGELVNESSPLELASVAVPA